MLNTLSSNFIITFCAVIAAAGVFLVVKSLGTNIWDWITPKLNIHKRRSVRDINDPSDLVLSDIESSDSGFIRMVKHPTFWIIGGAIFALFLWDIIISPLAFTTVVLIGGSFRSGQTLKESARLDSHVDILVSSFRSHVISCPDTQIALEKILPSIPEGPLRKATERIVSTLQQKVNYKKAFYPWLLFGNPMLERFAFLLAGAEGVPSIDIATFLDAFQNSQKPWFEMRKGTRSSLNMIGMVGNILLVLTVVSLITAGILPQWKEFLISSLNRYLLYIGSLVLLLISMLYYQIELQRLEEN